MVETVHPAGELGESRVDVKTHGTKTTVSPQFWEVFALGFWGLEKQLERDSQKTISKANRWNRLISEENEDDSLMSELPKIIRHHMIECFLLLPCLYNICIYTLYVY